MIGRKRQREGEGVELGGCQRISCRRAKRTFMTGAQKCTVLKPMGLSHMRLNQPTCWAASCSALAVDCHLRPHCCRCWLRNACWKPEAREKACRVWAAAEAEEKSGRDARVKAAAEEDMSLVAALVVGSICGLTEEILRGQVAGRRARAGLAGVESWGLSWLVSCVTLVSRGANPGEVRSNRGPIKGALGVNRRVGKSWGRSWRAGDKKM